MTFYTNKFIDSLYVICERNEYKNIIRWDEDGNSFTIFDPIEFSKQIMSEYFITKNFKNFIRQLNRYGFTKIKKMSKEWTFSHKFFIKGRKDLLSRISRKQQSKKGYFYEFNFESESTVENEENNAVLFNTYTVNALTTITQYFDSMVTDIKYLKNEIEVLNKKLSYTQTANLALILDDCEENAFDMHKKLKQLNFNAFYTTQSEIFEIFLKQNTFKIVFLSLENRNVEYIYKKIIKTTKSAIILMSKNENTFETISQTFHNVNGIIQKPCEFIELQHLINRTINQKILELNCQL